MLSHAEAQRGRERRDCSSWCGGGFVESVDDSDIAINQFFLAKVYEQSKRQIHCDKISFYLLEK